MRPFSAITLAFTLGLGLSATHAASDDTRIFQAPKSAFEASKSKKFVINPELGRAWVEVNLYYTASESTDYYRVAVPGLSYDKERSEVVFDAEGTRVVCATVEQSGWWLFRHENVKPTGACELTHRYVKVPIDNGFAVEHIEHFEVHFKPQVSAIDSEAGQG